jgi:hypothetical protein
MGRKNSIWQLALSDLEFPLHKLSGSVVLVMQTLEHRTSIPLTRDGGWRNYLPTFGLIKEGNKAFDVLAAF